MQLGTTDFTENAMLELELNKKQMFFIAEKSSLKQTDI